MTEPKITIRYLPGWTPPCAPCSEYQAGTRQDVVMFGSMRAHVCERIPVGLDNMRAGGPCPCGCERR